MKNISKFLLLSAILAFVMMVSEAQQRQMKAPGLQDSLLLKDYKPQSIFVIPRDSGSESQIPCHRYAYACPAGG